MLSGVPSASVISACFSRTMTVGEPATLGGVSVSVVKPAMLKPKSKATDVADVRAPAPVVGSSVSVTRIGGISCGDSFPAFGDIATAGAHVPDGYAARGAASHAGLACHTRGDELGGVGRGWMKTEEEGG